MPLVHNEKTKLIANALDRASTACFTVGILSPVAAFLYDLVSVKAPPYVTIAAGLCVWLTASAALHGFARRVLGGLQE